MSCQNPGTSEKELHVKLENLSVNDPQRPTTSGKSCASTDALAAAGAKAMQINSILETIANYLPIRDLNILRQTSHTWNQHFIPELKRQHGEVTIQDRGELEKFTTDMSSSVAIPFTKVWFPDINDALHDIDHPDDYYFWSADECWDDPPPAFQEEEYSDQPKTKPPAPEETVTQQQPESPTTDFFRTMSYSLTRLRLDVHCSYWEEVVPELSKIRRIIFELTPPCLTDLHLTLEVIPVQKSGYPSSVNNFLFDIKNPVHAVELPQLRTLTIEIRVDRRRCASNFERPSTFTWNHLTQFLTDLVSNAVGLKHLSIFESKSWDWFSLIVNCLPHPENLRTLQVSDLGASEFGLLLKLGERPQNTLRLRKLKLVSYSDDEYPEFYRYSGYVWNAGMIHSFLVTQESTLEVLLIHNPAPQESDLYLIKKNLPKLKRLTSFTTIGQSSLSNITFDEGSMDANFPLLTRFVGSCKNVWFEDGEIADPAADDDGYTQVDMERFRHDGVTDLVLEIKFSHLTAFTTSGVFPSVTHAVLQLEDHLQSNESSEQLLATIWTAWPNLISLTLCIHRTHSYFPSTTTYYSPPEPQSQLLDLDVILTGISRYNLYFNVEPQLLADDTPSELDPKSLTRDTIQSILTKYKTQPGISDCKRLQKFVLLIDEQFEVILTDAGGYVGFGACPQIQHVKITSYLGKEDLYGWISNECIQFIKSSILGPHGLLEITRNQTALSQPREKIKSSIFADWDSDSD